jgi:hypothetical protein
MITAAEFRAAQRRLRAQGNPQDPCGRCGCMRNGHLPPPTYSFAKSGGSSGKVSRDPGASCHVLRLQILFLFLCGVRRALPQPTVPKLSVRSQIQGGDQWQKRRIPAYRLRA